MTPSSNQPLNALSQSQSWVMFFEANHLRPLEAPWEQGLQLTAGELIAIIKSVRDFHLGEQSEGHHLFRAAKFHADATGDLAYLKSIRLFIKEEQRHSFWLKQFMEIEDIPAAEESWTDNVFRKLRKGSPLEQTVSILVTAEIIAKVFYATLADATRSTILKAICQRILQDELAHIQFQCERLALLRRSRKTVWLFFTHALHRLFFLGTILVVWQQHFKVFRLGKRPFSTYWQQCWQEYNHAQAIMNPRNYHTSENEMTNSPSVSVS